MSDDVGGPCMCGGCARCLRDQGVAECPECHEFGGCDCLVGEGTKKTFGSFLEQCVSDSVNGGSGDWQEWHYKRGGLQEWHEKLDPADHVCWDCGREYHGDFCSICREHYRRLEGR